MRRRSECRADSPKIAASGPLLATTESYRESVVEWGNATGVAMLSKAPSDRAYAEALARRVLVMGVEAAEQYNRWYDLPQWTDDLGDWAVSPEAMISLGVKALFALISLQTIVVASQFVPDDEIRRQIRQYADLDWSRYGPVYRPLAEQSAGRLWADRHAGGYVNETADVLRSVNEVLAATRDIGYTIVRTHAGLEDHDAVMAAWRARFSPSERPKT